MNLYNELFIKDKKILYIKNYLIEKNINLLNSIINYIAQKNIPKLINLTLSPLYMIMQPANIFTMAIAGTLNYSLCFISYYIQSTLYLNIIKETIVNKDCLKNKDTKNTSYNTLLDTNEQELSINLGKKNIQNEFILSILNTNNKNLQYRFLFIASAKNLCLSLLSYYSAVYISNIVSSHLIPMSTINPVMTTIITPIVTSFIVYSILDQIIELTLPKEITKYDLFKIGNTIRSEKLIEPPNITQPLIVEKQSSSLVQNQSEETDSMKNKNKDINKNDDMKMYLITNITNVNEEIITEKFISNTSQLKT